MIDNWIDALCKIWEVEDGRGGTVTSYRLFERDEFPEEIPLDRPTALTFVDGVDFQYSQGGPLTAIWKGSTEFNLTPDLSRKRVPAVLRYFKRIMAAATDNMKLGGLVSYFILDETDTITLEVLQYGNQARHLGLVVNWTVKEVLSSADLTVGDDSL
jgi:hypothetical protein